MSNLPFMDNQQFSTKGLALNSLIISQLIVSSSGMATDVEWPTMPTLPYSIVSKEPSQLTAVGYSIKSAASESQNYSFDEVVTNFYADLENRQQQLGDKFEKVLLENLTDLYEA